MAESVLKYLHVDSDHRDPHESTSKLDIKLGNSVLKSVRRVGVLKASIMNTGHNIHTGHDTVSIGVFAKSSAGTSANVIFDIQIKHQYIQIDSLLIQIDNAIKAYTHPSLFLQNAVRACLFSKTTENHIELKMGAITGGTTGFVTLIAPEGSTPNSLYSMLGFSGSQTVTPGIFEGLIVLDIDGLVGNAKSAYEKASSSDRDKVVVRGGSNSISIIGHDLPSIENPMGFYLTSRDLTGKGSVMRTVNINGSHASVIPDEHICFIPNIANRDQYCHFEAPMVQWHEINGDIQHFDLELRNHKNILFGVDDIGIINEKNHGAIPPFQCTLVFECVQHDESSAEERRLYHIEAYQKGHPTR